MPVTLSNLDKHSTDSHVEHHRPPAPPVTDLRQVAVTVAEIGCILGTLVGVGVPGTRVEESSGGACRHARRFARPVRLSIWSVIYGSGRLHDLAVLSANTANLRARSGWLVALSMLLNAAWLLVAQQGWLWASVGVIAAPVDPSGALRRLDETAPTRAPVLVVVDGTMGLYSGMGAVATCANVTATLVASESTQPGRPRRSPSP